MNIQLRRTVAIIAAWAIWWFAVPGNLRAQEQIVPPAQLHTELQKAAQTRQGNLEAINRVLATDAAREQMRTARLDPALVQRALPQLSDAELARLADMARSAEADLAAGLVGWVIGLLALIGALVIILIVVFWVA